MDNPKILIIDDNEDVLLAAKLLLKPLTKNIYTEKNPENIPKIMSESKFDIIFLDMNFSMDITSGEEGFFWLKKIISIDSSAIIILITAYGDIETAVRAIKEGATDFIIKPWQNEKFIATLNATLKLRESKVQIEALTNQNKELTKDIEHSFPNLLGKSESMIKVFTTIEKVAKTEANVLILGENGTGKELVARALYNKSNRSDKIFLSVDMGAISPTLFESELFGHTKGAFTDAKEERAGRFEIASGGTLFLDEIGNISLEQQAKLLSVLQKREVARVGSNKYKPIDIRLICATNLPINQMVNENKFRQDLLYRINTVEIKIPPLRDRCEDIPLLTDYYLSIYKKKYNKQELNFDNNTYEKLMNYKWPGNVRELQHSIERAVILCENRSVNPSDFFFTIENSDHQQKETNMLDDVEKSVIKKVLAKYDGNISKAAKELGLTRTSLYRRMDKYGL